MKSIFKISTFLAIALFFSLGLTSKAEAAYPFGDEVVLYHFEDIATGTTTDGTTGTTTNSGTSATANDGLLIGNASTTALQFRFGSKSAVFGEVTDLMRTLYGNGIDPTSQSISVSLWLFKGTNNCTSDDDHVFGTSGSPTNNRFYIRCKNSTTNKWGYRIQGNAEVFSTASVSTTNWDHVVLVANASTDTATFYVNNAAIGSPVAYTTYTLPGPFFVGNFNDVVGGSTNQGAGAYIDEVAIYSRALTASEVNEIYQAGQPSGVISALTATPYEGKVFLSWTAGSGTTTDYIAEYKLTSDSSWTTFNDGVSTVASTTVTGLSNGSSYDFRITPKNGEVVGTVSSTVSATPNYRILFVAPAPTEGSTVTASNSITVYASTTSAIASTTAATSASSTDKIRLETSLGSLVSEVSTTTHYGDYNLAHLTNTLYGSNLALLDNSSGLAYVSTTDTIFLVHNRATNSDSTIDEIDKNGVLIREITCTQCGDVEGITLISSVASSTVGGYDHTFMLSTENDTANAEIYRVVIHSTGSVTVNKNDYFDTGITHSANGGLEGIAYDSARDVFYVARELSTPTLYQVTLSSGHNASATAICTNLTWNAGVTDFSDLTFNNNILYVLSENTDPSKLVAVNVTSTSTCAYVDSDNDGDSSSSDTGDWLIVDDAVGATDQAEGVTWDSTGDTLWVLGEADFLAKYRTTKYTTRHTFTGVSNGDYVLKASFLDTNGITTNAVNRSFTLNVDSTAPVISNIASTTSLTSATVTWDTDEVSNSKVSYGTVSSTYTTSTSSASLITSHSIGLTSLSPSTLYYYVVVSADSTGNISTSTEKTLLTSSPDLTSPTVSVTAPLNGATVSGASVSLAANASDNVSVSGVQFKLDTNTNIGAEDTSSAYGVTWDTTAGVSDGSHTLIAVARDNSGNYATSSVITVTVDNTAPVRSAGAPSGTLSSGTTGTSLSLTTNESALCRYSASSGIAYGSMTAFSSGTTTTHSTAITGLSDNTSYSYYVKCQDGQGNTNATDYTISFSVAADGSAPSLSSISSGTPGSTGATITWDTDEGGSSQVDYGLTASYTASTTEADTSPRVLSHSVSLSQLISCTVYHYRVRSTDSNSNTAVGSDMTFTTSGCTGNTSVENQTISPVSNSSGGQVSLLESGDGLVLNVPAGFATGDLSFQIIKLAASGFNDAAGTPLTTLSLVSDFVYHLSAYTNATSTISSFLAPLTVTIDYSDSDVNGIDESSLSMYRYDGSAWHALSSCSVDTGANSVSCTTTSFSDFGLFGTVASSGGSNRSGSIPTIRKKQIALLNATPTPNVSPVPTPVSKPPSVFLDPSVLTRRLSFGMKGEDVSSIQRVLATNPALYPQGEVTGYFGMLTKTAIQNFQIVYGVAKIGDLGFGEVGPMTRAKLIELFGNTSTGTTFLKPIPPISTQSPNVVFTAPLRLGISHKDVLILQKILNRDQETVIAKEGSGSPQFETEYFGALTKKAVEKFQIKYGIAKAGDPGFGDVGPGTRAKLNQLLLEKPL